MHGKDGGEAAGLGEGACEQGRAQRARDQTERQVLRFAQAAQMPRILSESRTGAAPGYGPA